VLHEKYTMQLKFPDWPWGDSNAASTNFCHSL